MDKITACGAVDRGPIPRGGTINKKCLVWREYLFYSDKRGAK